MQNLETVHFDKSYARDRSEVDRPFALLRNRFSEQPEREKYPLLPPGRVKAIQVGPS